MRCVIDFLKIDLKIIKFFINNFKLLKFIYSVIIKNNKLQFVSVYWVMYKVNNI